MREVTPRPANQRRYTDDALGSRVCRLAPARALAFRLLSQEEPIAAQTAEVAITRSVRLGI